MSRRSKIALFAFALAVLAVVSIALLTYFVNLRMAVDTATHDAALHFSIYPPFIVPGACVTVAWRAEGIREIYLNGAGVAGEGEKELCGILDNPVFFVMLPQF